MYKIKVLKEGEKCRHCNTPVIYLKTKRKKIKKNQEYYFNGYLYCPNCKEFYMLESEKVFIKKQKAKLFE